MVDDRELVEKLTAGARTPEVLDRLERLEAATRTMASLRQEASRLHQEVERL